MKELSLNILDIAKNSVKARASEIFITLEETAQTLKITVSDNGCGMKEDFLKTVADPWSTTRTTRSVGMGIPLFKLAAEQTGGELTIVSRHESECAQHGTSISALFYKNSIDFTPLGDIVSSVVTLIQGSPKIRWVFRHSAEGGGEVLLDTAQLTEVLGDVPLDVPEVLMWITQYLNEAYGQMK